MGGGAGGVKEKINNSQVIKNEGRGQEEKEIIKGRYRKTKAADEKDSDEGM